MLEKAKALALQYYDCKLFEPEANKQVQMRRVGNYGESIRHSAIAKKQKNIKKDAEEIEKERRLPGDIKWGE